MPPRKKKAKPKKVLVTGFTSRQCNPAKNARDVMVSWLIAEVCRDLGYEVEHRNPTIEESYEEFDHVFWGMAPLHGLGSNRSYGALSCFLKCYPSGKISFYQDDEDNAKVANGIRTVHNDPARLTKRFFDYKLEWHLANTPEWSKFLRQGVEVLDDYAWPTTVIPAFQWADVRNLTKSCPNLVDAVPIDFTEYLPKFDIEWPTQRKQQWVAEVPPSAEKWFNKQRIEWFPIRYGKGYDKRPDDSALVSTYADSYAVLDKTNDFGWWTSRIGYASQAGALYVTRWQNVEALGDAYGLLPYHVEEMDDETRDVWATAQGEALKAMTETRESVKDKIKKLVEK